ncbi:MAG: N-acetyltransferase [Saprospiraceae bacterium]|jgi:phosphinothricin acetyltransferase|nr:N-acetyltransferase [Saprospiraceae bacterium]MBL0023872.1 N-acetyltransferase [Saprospiraceae bacterium]
MKIRFASDGDLERIVEIYNQAIEAGNATADVSLLTAADRKYWFSDHSQNDYPIYVVEEQNKIIGWGSLSPYRKGRAGLKETAEISYYLDYAYHGRGYAKRLIEYIIADCRRLGIKNIFALLLDVNLKSVNILEKMGFHKWGYMPDVAKLNGNICGHLIYGQSIQN